MAEHPAPVGPAARMTGMSFPGPSARESGDPRPVSGRQPDLGTDPGRAQPFESLYRAAAGAPAAAYRGTTRHFVPALTPPEEPHPDDTFHWLYRSEPAAGAQAPVLEDSWLSRPESPPLPETPIAFAPRRSHRGWWVALTSLCVLLALGATAVIELGGLG
jgi:hypothetical protein